jgi:hypothetical protein
MSRKSSASKKNRFIDGRERRKSGRRKSMADHGRDK